MYLYVYVLFCITNELRLASVSYFSLFCFCVFFQLVFLMKLYCKQIFQYPHVYSCLKSSFVNMYSVNVVEYQFKSNPSFYIWSFDIYGVSTCTWGKNDAYNLTSKTCLLDVIFAQYSVFLGLCLLNHKQCFVPWKKLYSFT